jgi:hypothetical protein
MGTCIRIRKAAKIGIALSCDWRSGECFPLGCIYSIRIGLLGSLLFVLFSALAHSPTGTLLGFYFSIAVLGCVMHIAKGKPCDRFSAGVRLFPLAFGAGLTVSTSDCFLASFLFSIKQVLDLE